MTLKTKRLALFLLISQSDRQGILVMYFKMHLQQYGTHYSLLYSLAPAHHSNMNIQHPPLTEAGRGALLNLSFLRSLDLNPTA